ncbi:MAG: terminase family protein [Deltaproteobacteria bacterium]|jgi:hypothetical protein|nr:terminase family protein [Deltaproteobacteria bacterium]
MESPKIIWTPNSDPQRLFLSCPFDEVLFGGSRGPGKTDSLLMDFAQHTGVGLGVDWKGILFRATYKQLEEVIHKTRKFYPRIFPGAKYSSSNFEWTFPAGETLKLRHVANIHDMENYQGHEYPWIGWEEICNWPDLSAYELSKALCRSTNPNAPRKMRATANPLGRGHLEVKRYFIDIAPPFTPYTDSTGRTRVFIPATVYDNKDLMLNDPNYVKGLESIEDENYRRAWLYGDWDVVAGAFFGDLWRKDKHVIFPFDIPTGWYCFRSFDWGSAKPFSVGWWTIADGTKAPDGVYYPRGALIRFAEWYGCKKNTPNTGLRLTSKDVAKSIKERESKFIKAYGIKINPGPADPAIYAHDDGPSIAENMKSVGVSWVQADNSRLAGWEQVRERLKGTEDGKPLLYIFNTCLDTIRTLPSAPRDEAIWDDIDTEYEDHALDDLRYACMARKRFARFN